MSCWEPVGKDRLNEGGHWDSPGILNIYFVLLQKP